MLCSQKVLSLLISFVPPSRFTSPPSWTRQRSGGKHQPLNVPQLGQLRAALGLGSQRLLAVPVGGVVCASFYGRSLPCPVESADTHAVSGGVLALGPGVLGPCVALESVVLGDAGQGHGVGSLLSLGAGQTEAGGKVR
jgi:hypothetical protein